MKRTLLFLSFIFFVANLSFSQSFSERLEVKTPEKIDIQVFPNPFTSHISLGENATGHVGKILIFNLVGRQMKSFDFVDGEKYYVGDLPKGMYLIQLLGAKGKILRTKRVSKR